MTHRVHPYAHRLGILRDWRSRWFGLGGDYKEYLRTDLFLRRFLTKALREMHVSDVEIERRGVTTRIIIKSSRPGLIIGKSGEGVTSLRTQLEKIVRTNKLIGADEIKIDIEEIRSPESHAALVAQMIREGIEKRMPFRRVMKQTVDKVMANRDVEGVRVTLSGILGGDMGRTEKMKKGRVPLQTFRADIDYAHDEARVPRGQVGIKVWIYRGDIFTKKQTAERA